MKKIIILCISFLIIFLASACERHSVQPHNNDYGLPNSSEKNEPEKNAQNNIYIRPGAIPDQDKNTQDNSNTELDIFPDTEEKVQNNGNTESDTILVQTIVYKNEKLGFELAFPESWRGWYVINEIRENAVEVAFYGKSKTSTVEFLEEDGKPGLHMFFVANEAFIEESPFLDGIEEIGTVGAMKFYYATTTDWPLGVLFDGGMSSDTNDETETLLIISDFEKAMQMTDEVGDIILTFKAIR